MDLYRTMGVNYCHFWVAT